MTVKLVAMVYVIVAKILLIMLLVGCSQPTRITLFEERHLGINTPQTEILSKFHTVERAENLYSIAKKYKATTRDLIKVNNLQPPYRIFVGQRLALPARRNHRVEKGDTVYGISRRHGVAISQLVQVNRLKSPYKIIVGQILQLPGSVVSGLVKKSSVKTMLSGRIITHKGSAELTTLKKQTLSSPPSHRKSPLTPLPKSRGGFMWPIDGKIVSKFGMKGKGLHNDGINLAAPRGTSVRAAQSGIVAYAGNELRGFGKLVLVRHEMGIMSAYAHNEALLVKPGDQVLKGQTIAKVGSTGSVDKPQLHFEIRKGRNAIDPIRFLGRHSTLSHSYNSAFISNFYLNFRLSLG